jgi:DNA polymerase III alpha subunit
MVCRADTIGVFQIESRAQMSMLPRLKPRRFYDLVIQVAIVRPGPIHGNMVHPYLKRRAGIEKVSFPDVRVKEILEKTLGVPLFQEQAMRLAIVLAKFTPGEAEQLRRAMAAWKRNKGLIATFNERIMNGMRESGYTRQFAEACCEQIRGFSEYGFPESHAASFALLVYASSWLKRYYPAEFAAALLNSQPMGFYAPAQIVRDAENHGVKVLPIDVNASEWDCILERSDEGAATLRLGMRYAKGMREDQAQLISELRRGAGHFASVEDLWKRGHTRRGVFRLRKAALQALARADAFGSMELTSRQALWAIRALVEEILPLDERADSNETERARHAPLPALTPQQSMFNDFAATGLSLKAHPLSFIRTKLDERMVCTAAVLRDTSKRKLKNIPVNSLVSVAGVAIIRQRPGTAKGMVFITLEDETGITNLVIRPDVFEKFHKIIVSSACLLAHGVLDRVGEVVYINAHALESLDADVLGRQKSDLPNSSFSY